MKLPEMKDEAFLRLAREEDNCSISAGSMHGVFHKRGGPAAEASVPVRKASSPLTQAKGHPARGAMTLNVTVSDTVYRQIAELAARHRVSVERIVAAALAEQVSGWARVEQIADRDNLERCLAALDKVPGGEPAREDRR
jgi:hypothetical protein